MEIHNGKDRLYIETRPGHFQLTVYAGALLFITVTS